MTDEKQSPGDQAENNAGEKTPSAVASANDKKHASRADARGSGKDAVTKRSTGHHVNQKRPSRAALWLAILALMLSMAAGGGGYWLWLQGRSGIQGQERQSQQLKDLQSQFAQLQQQIKSDSQKQQIQWQQFEQQQTQEQMSIRQQLSQSRDPNWILAEAEYLIRIADHRLQLVKDVDTAVSALSLADQRLQVLRDPRLLPVRRLLNEDINRLKAVPRIDVTGMALTLSSLQSQLEQLPLSGRITLSTTEDQRAIDERSGEEKKGWTRFLSDLWTSLKGLVTVRRLSEQSAAILPLEQRGYLYQNLALKLETARYALLLDNDVLYHRSLATARDWLQHYFDQQDAGVESVVSTLKHLDSVSLDRVLPPAASALPALQDIERRKQVAPAAVQPSKHKSSTENKGAAATEPAAQKKDSGDAPATEQQP